MAKEMEIYIDYVPEDPATVRVDAESFEPQVFVRVPGMSIYLYEATAEALRDALISALGLPEAEAEENAPADDATEA